MENNRIMSRTATCAECGVSAEYLEGWRHVVDEERNEHVWSYDYPEGGITFHLTVRVAMHPAFERADGRRLCIWRITPPAKFGGHVEGSSYTVDWCVREMVNRFDGKPSSIERYARNLKRHKVVAGQEMTP